MHHLAIDLGKTLTEIEDMPLAEFHRWLAWYRVELPGVRADDFRAAAVCQAVANQEAYNAELKKKRRTIPITRFYRDPWQKQAGRSIISDMKQLAKRFKPKAKGVDTNG